MFFRNHKILVSVIGAVVVLCGAGLVWSTSASWRGQLAAHLDLRRGHYVLLAYGLPEPEAPEYALLLKQRYGIEVKTVALCIVSPTLQAYADSYDDVSANAAKRKFGRDVFQECWELAVQRHRIAVRE